MLAASETCTSPSAAITSEGERPDATISGSTRMRAAWTENFTGSFPDPTLSDRLYTYAWFVTFGLGFVVYYVLMKGHPGVKRDAASS